VIQGVDARVTLKWILEGKCAEQVDLTPLTQVRIGRCEDNIKMDLKEEV
jgi:hypothetical protein